MDFPSYMWASPKTPRWNLRSGSLIKVLFRCEVIIAECETAQSYTYKYWICTTLRWRCACLAVCRRHGPDPEFSLVDCTFPTLVYLVICLFRLQPLIFSWPRGLQKRAGGRQQLHLQLSRLEFVRIIWAKHAYTNTMLWPRQFFLY